MSGPPPLPRRRARRPPPPVPEGPLAWDEVGQHSGASLGWISLGVGPAEKGGGWVAVVRLPPPVEDAPLYALEERETLPTQAAARAWAEARGRLRLATPPEPDPVAVLAFHLARGEAPPMPWVVHWSRADAEPVAAAWAASVDGVAMHQLLEWVARRTGVHALRRADVENDDAFMPYAIAASYHGTAAGRAVIATRLHALAPAVPPLTELLRLALAPAGDDGDDDPGGWLPGPVRRRDDTVVSVQLERVLRPTGVVEDRRWRRFRYADEETVPTRPWAPIWAEAIARRRKVPLAQRRAAVRRAAAGEVPLPGPADDEEVWAAKLLGVDPPRGARDDGFAGLALWAPRARRPRAPRPKPPVVLAPPGDDGPLFEWAKARGRAP